MTDTQDDSFERWLDKEEEKFILSVFLKVEQKIAITTDARHVSRWLAGSISFAAQRWTPALPENLVSRFSA